MAGSAPIAKRDVHLKRTFQAFENRGYVRLWLANFLLYTSLDADDAHGLAYP